MKISFVVAASDNGVIGLHNQLPWHLPDDLKFFKKNTTGKPIIMGRKTFESFGKPLPKRINIILSRSLKETPPEGTLCFDSMEEALGFAEKESNSEVCIIGGGQIFKEYRDLADEILLTRVHTEIKDGDTFFELPDKKNWTLLWSENHSIDDKHAFDFTFEKWGRKK